MNTFSIFVFVIFFLIYMRCYIIITQTSSSDRYVLLHERIKSVFTKWARLTDGSWAIVTDSNSKKIREVLKKSLDIKSDRLMVIRYGGESAWMNLRAGNEWLHKNLKTGYEE